MDIKESLIEEYKVLIAERHQVMSKYVQALTLYLALMGIAFKEYYEEKSLVFTLILGLFLTFINIVSLYGAKKFSHMSKLVEIRLTQVSKDLGFFNPYSLVWGLHFGIAIFISCEIGLIVIYLFKLYFN